jgi:hypothetical protein
MLIQNGPDSKADREAKSARGTQHRWHAVAIVAGAGACAAAAARKGQRYLAREAPQLPLPDCDAQRCSCKYRHFEDRRGPARRATEREGIRARAVANERRAKRGRRATD